MNKIVRIGTIATYGGRQISVYCRIKNQDGRLSISGVEGPLPSGNAVGSCGQISMHYAHRNPADNDARSHKLAKPSDIKFAKGWDSNLWLDFLAIWSRWHLNDIRAGSPSQEAWLRDNPITYQYPESHYEKACTALEAAGLNPDPESGYEYGSAWMKEEVPADVIAFLEALPAADQNPAWA